MEMPKLTDQNGLGFNFDVVPSLMRIGYSLISEVLEVQE